MATNPKTNDSAKPPVVSVVVPVYNTAKYLDQCLDSIAAQSVENIEVICIDDGSTDESGTMLDRRAGQDSRFRVVHVENGGVSAARNLGLEQAKGHYVVFWDSDDFFEPNALELMAARAINLKADIIVCPGYYYDEKLGTSTPANSSYLKSRFVPEKQPFSIKTDGRSIFTFTTFNPFNKLYKREFLVENGIKFPPQKLSEDAVFFERAVACADRIGVVKSRLFHYRVNNSTSATNSATKDILAGYRTLLGMREDLISRGVYSDDVRWSFANKALDSLLHYLNICNSYEAFQEWFDCVVAKNGFANLDITEDTIDRAYSEDLANRYRILMKYADDRNQAVFWLFRDEMRRRLEAQAKEAIAKQEAKALKKPSMSEQVRAKGRHYHNMQLINSL